MGDFKKTYAILSAELNIPILPVAISGAYEAMSSGKKKIKSGSKIIVAFLPPVEPAGMTPRRTECHHQGPDSRNGREKFERDLMIFHLI